jgi:hypothetical protein
MFYAEDVTEIVVEVRMSVCLSICLSVIGPREDFLPIFCLASCDSRNVPNLVVKNQMVTERRFGTHWP